MDDVIVVGAGLGGLVLGALLAKRGYKVTVLEQHYIPGGCATIFRRKHFRFEVGLHAMDGMDESDPKMRIFHELDMVNKVPFVHIPRTEFYRFKHADLDITMPGSAAGAIVELSRRFPHERRRIEEFFATMTTIRRDLCSLFVMEKWKLYGSFTVFPFLYPKLLQYWNSTIGDYLDALFDDELLKLTLIANILYYHDDPRRLSLFWYCLSQGSFFAGGVHFVKGGSQVLSNYLADYIRAHGGEILLGQNVEEILVEHGCATGVRFRKTLGRNPTEGIRYARAIVANAALPVVVNELVKSPKIEPFRNKINDLQKSCSFLSLYLGLDKTPKALGNNVFSTVVAGEGVTRFDDLPAEFKGKNWAQKGFEFVDYSQIDHGLAPAGMSVGVISLVDYITNWEHLSEADYYAQKEEVAQTLFTKLNHLVPGIRDNITCYEVGTPKTIARYTKNPEGCIYGFHQNVNQTTIFRPGATSPIQNLYFASAWTMPGGGFTGAMLSGMNCAYEVEAALGSTWRTRSKRWFSPA